MSFSPVIVIPVYNHPDTIGPMVDAGIAHGLHCIIVDDGSEARCATVLDNLARSRPLTTTLVRLPHNQGKGGAMIEGLRTAHTAGYTHAVQIDADGQHDPSDIPHFLSSARENVQAVICGCPQYDETVPKGRLYARYLTHVWVWINTLSFDIRDSMCGFRVYPLGETVAVLDSVRVGRRMDFDTEILVRLLWRGLQIVNIPTPVRYPLDGISHFRIVLDNVLISRMHARLFLGMLRRLPQLLGRKAVQS